MTSGNKGFARGNKHKLAVGILVTISSSLLLIAAVFCRGWPYMYVDFPCEWFGYPSALSDTNTRLAYCISYWPRNAISGGAIYAYGSVDEDKVSAELQVQGFWHGPLTFERQGEMLLVNGQSLRPGEMSDSFRWFPSLNPWLLFTTHLTVTNEGPREVQGVSSDTIYVSGDMREGWLPSPVGLIALGIGLWLLVCGARERQRARPDSCD